MKTKKIPFTVKYFREHRDANVVTASGEVVHILTVEAINNPDGRPVVGMVDGRTYSWTKDGRRNPNDKITHDDLLIDLGEEMTNTESLICKALAMHKVNPTQFDMDVISSIAENIERGFASEIYRHGFDAGVKSANFTVELKQPKWKRSELHSIGSCRFTIQKDNSVLYDCVAGMEISLDDLLNLPQETN